MNITTDPASRRRNFTIGGWALIGIGALVLAVSGFANHMTASMAANLAYGEGTVLKLWSLQRSAGGSARQDRRADVRLADAANTVVKVDIDKAAFDRLSEGDQLAVAWDRGNPDFAIASRYVDQLVRGEIPPAEFLAGQKFAARLGMSVGAVLALIGVTIIMTLGRRPH